MGEGQHGSEVLHHDDSCCARTQYKRKSCEWSWKVTSNGTQPPEQLVNLPELFDFSLMSRRDAVGLEFEDQSYTFGELDSRSNRVARWLLSNGFTSGDRLCVYLPNCVDMI